MVESEKERSQRRREDKKVLEKRRLEKRRIQQANRRQAKKEKEKAGRLESMNDNDNNMEDEPPPPMETPSFLLRTVMEGGEEGDGAPDVQLTTEQLDRLERARERQHAFNTGTRNDIMQVHNTEVQQEEDYIHAVVHGTP